MMIPLWIKIDNAKRPKPITYDRFFACKNIKIIAN